MQVICDFFRISQQKKNENSFFSLFADCKRQINDLRGAIGKTNLQTKSLTEKKTLLT